MKLSFSNIAWCAEDDTHIYDLLKQNGFCGVEIAPTRIFPNNPYGDLNVARRWSENTRAVYGLSVSSMQSIWYGRTEKLFGTPEEYDFLISYTKKAIDFASAIGCKNLVFGCPRNREIPNNANPEIAVRFFREVGDYAFSHSTCIGMEANPPIYNTNYITDTSSAIELIKEVGSKGFKLNLDIGTMIYNHEDVLEIEKNVNLINHVHISEPGLKPLQEREIHKSLAYVLHKNEFPGYISVEMAKIEDKRVLKRIINYVKTIFC